MLCYQFSFQTILHLLLSSLFSSLTSFLRASLEYLKNSIRLHGDLFIADFNHLPEDIFLLIHLQVSLDDVASLHLAVSLIPFCYFLIIFLLSCQFISNNPLVFLFLLILHEFVQFLKETASDIL